MPKYQVILNPTAGRGVGDQSEPEVRRLLGEHKLDFQLVRTERPWHAADLAQRAAEEGCDVVVAVGGDGTANEVINGLMRATAKGTKKVALGVLSVGSGNDFAYGVGVPADLEAAVQALAQDHRRPIDLGLVSGGLYPEGRYFGNGVGIGFDAVVGFEALKLKRLSGFISYLVAVLKVVFLYFRAPNVRIEYDDGEMTQPALMVSIMNGRRLGGGFMMAPSAKTDDGLFNLCIAGQVSRARILTLIPHFIKGTQATQKPITTAVSKRVVVTAQDEALPAHADGETLCVDGRQLSVELLPQAIEIIS